MVLKVTINIEDAERFDHVMKLYPHNFAQTEETEDKLAFIILGEDMEKDSLLQEALMEHLDEIEIEETIGKEE